MIDTKTDPELQRAVLEELEFDPLVNANELGVVVEDRVVTLTGTVARWAEKEAAQRAAHRIAGVHDVANEIEVRRPPRRSDHAIAHAVRSTLSWNRSIPHDRIQTTVEDGIVTLVGGVDSVRQRDDAERAVAVIDGVLGVVNQLAIESPALDAEELRASIEAALHRHVAREAQRIEIVVRDGTVALHGSVTSSAEHTAIVGVARGTRGVRAIDDHLVVE